MIATFGVAPEKVTTARLAPRRRFRPVDPSRAAAARRRFALPPKFVLFVGTIEPRKNVSLLLDAYQALPPSVREEYDLVIAGPPGWAMMPPPARYITSSVFVCLNVSGA